MPGNRDLKGLTFDEIAARYGEEAAIAAGIAADPDARELTDTDFARMRPASEVVPVIVEAYRRTRGKQKAPVACRAFTPGAARPHRTRT